MKTCPIRGSVRSRVPKAMLAAVIASRKSRWGTVVQSLRAVSGSSEVAMVAAAAPPPMAEATRASFPPARHKDSGAILLVSCRNSRPRSSATRRSQKQSV